MSSLGIRAIALLAALGCLLLLGLSPGPAWAGKWKEKSRQHEADCKQWCSENPDVCDHCSTLAGCGGGFRSIRSWTGYGKNWHACARNDRGIASQRNKDDCNRWCEEHRSEGCVRCSGKVGCGKGYDRMHSFTGYGDNWYACKKRPTRDEATEANRLACERHCRGNWMHEEKCERCSRYPDCGHGYERVRDYSGRKLDGYTGRGNNYYLCRKRRSYKESGQGNKEECEEFCERFDEHCRYCTDKHSGCKPYERIQTFKGRGKNWWACGNWNR